MPEEASGILSGDAIEGGSKRLLQRLDSARGDEIMRLLKDLNKQGMTLIVITHDMAIAKQADRVIQIKDGKLARG